MCVCFFFQEGYRTLCVAYKQLSVEEYAQADAGLRDARLALQDREERLMAVYNQVETGMSLIGATAVEDRSVPAKLRHVVHPSLMDKHTVHPSSLVPHQSSHHRRLNL